MRVAELARSPGGGAGHLTARERRRDAGGAGRRGPGSASLGRGSRERRRGNGGLRPDCTTLVERGRRYRDRPLARLRPLPERGRCLLGRQHDDRLFGLWTDAHSRSREHDSTRVSGKCPAGRGDGDVCARGDGRRLLGAPPFAGAGLPRGEGRFVLLRSCVRRHVDEHRSVLGDQLVRAARRRNYRASARRRRAGNRTRRRLRLRCPIGELCGRDRRPCAVLGPRVRTDAERRGNSWRDTGGAWAWPRLCAHRGGGRRVCGGECVRAVGKPRFASEPDANGADRSRADRGGPRSYLCADGRGRREVLG
jgi:hypothetical protein